MALRKKVPVISLFDKEIVKLQTYDFVKIELEIKVVCRDKCFDWRIFVRIFASIVQYMVRRRECMHLISCLPETVSEASELDRFRNHARDMMEFILKIL